MANVGKLPGLKARAKREGWSSMIRTDADEHALLAGCTFDPKRADHAADFFPRFLRHTKGERFAGKPFELLKWQRDDVIRPLFGWIRRDASGRIVRRYKRAYAEIPKKNGKSTLLAGVGCYLLGGDGEPGAMIYSVACDRSQAQIVHGEAVRMIEGSPNLQRFFSVRGTDHRIIYRETQSFWKAMAGVGALNEGVDAHGFLCDEFHRWTGRKGNDLYGSIRYAIAARTSPLLFIITTAGDDPISVCKAEHDNAAGILRGDWFDDSYFAYIRAADDTDDPFAVATWKKANPSFGETINIDTFRDDARTAEKTPTATAQFCRYRLNMWVTGQNPAVKATDWRKCLRPFTLDDLRGRPCWGGLDLSRSEDSTALTLTFPDDDAHNFAVLTWYWIPHDWAVEIAGAVPWVNWADDPRSNLTLIPGRTIQYDWILKRLFGGEVEIAGEKVSIEPLSDAFEIMSIRFDPHNATFFASKLDEQGIEAVEFPQTMKHYSEPSAEFQKLIVEERLHHNGNPVLTWQIGNLQFKTDANSNRRPVKPNGRHDYRTVDGPVSLIESLGGALTDEAEGGGAYGDDDDDGVVMV
jgi:phage terminase large subunit-like protein